jgi:hypothetical protein
MHIQASALSRTILTPVFLASLLALPLGAAYAQGKGTVILNCSYAEGTHVQRTPMAGGNQEWTPAHDQVYHICAGCTVDPKEIRGYGGGNPPVWTVTDDEYSFDYSYYTVQTTVKIERYSGSATLVRSNSGMPDFYEGGVAIFTSTGKCQKADKPIL